MITNVEVYAQITIKEGEWDYVVTFEADDASLVEFEHSQMLELVGDFRSLQRVTAPNRSDLSLKITRALRQIEARRVVES